MKYLRLKSPKFDRVDLVDKGANYDLHSSEGSHILLFKREEKNMPKPDDKTPVTTGSAAEPETKKEEGEAPKEPSREELMEQLEAREKELAELKKKAEPEKREEKQPDVSEFLKTAPENVQEFFKSIKDQLATAEADAKEAQNIAKAERETRRTAEFRKRAETEFAHVPGDLESKTKLLRTLSDKLEPAEFAEIEKLFGQFEKIAKNSALFGEMGRGGGSAVSVEARIEAEAAKIREGDTKLTKEQSFAKALQENPELYNDYLRETEGR